MPWLLFAISASAETDPLAPTAPIAPIPKPQPGILFQDAMQIRIEVLLQDGDEPLGDGRPVTRLNSPFANGLGRVSFSGALEDGANGDFFLWHNDSILWLNSAHPEAGLAGMESSLGVSDTKGFVFSALANGRDSLWTQYGQILSQGSSAPGFPPGSTVTFANRPTMLPGGAAFWQSEVKLPKGNKPRVARALYTSPNASAGQIAVVLKTGDAVGDQTIARQFGLGLEYDVSDSGEHLIQLVRVESEQRPLPISAVYIDGALPMRQGDSTVHGALRDFDLVAINNDGHYLVAGETDAAGDSDYYLAYDGQPQIWEGSALAGVHLVPPATVRGLAINNLGHAVFAWSVAGFGVEHVFFACDASRLENAQLLFSTASKIDLDGDGEADAKIESLNGGNGPLLSLTKQDRVYVEVDLALNAGPTLETIMSVELPEALACEAARPANSPQPTASSPAPPTSPH